MLQRGAGQAVRVSGAVCECLQLRAARMLAQWRAARVRADGQSAASE